jgi:ABC-type proline/glycine betaine transport system ATPase subunit
MINRLIEPTSGSIHIGDQDISGQGADQLRRTIGYVIQAGISLLRYSVIVWGAVLVALLALLIEWLGRVLELVSRPRGV